MARNKTNSAGEVAYRGIYNTLRVLVHLTAAVQFSYAIYYDYTYVHFPASDKKISNNFGGKFKYLTFLNAIIQSLYYSISLINDFVGSNEVAPKNLPLIRRVKDYMMATFAFPIALHVGITFWGLYAIDRELVFPKVLDAIFPSWLNHIMHTNIAVFIILEMFISFRNYPSRTKGIAGLTTFMLCYLIWLHVVKYYSGVWVYPVLEVLQLPQRIVFFAGCLGFTIALYVFGQVLNNIVWSKEIKMQQRKHK